MAFTHQMTENGALLRTTTNGKIQGECCCGESNPCGTTNCTVAGQSVQCPSMQLRVFDADYSGPEIRWCGQTWSQSEVQAGTVKEACPGLYRRRRTTTTSAARETWYAAGITRGLWMVRAFNTANGYFENRVNICPKKPSTFVTTVDIPVFYPTTGSISGYLLLSLRRGTGVGGTYYSYYGRRRILPM